VVPFSFRKPLLDQINFSRLRSDAFCGFLLEYMQNINGILKTHCINRSPCIAVVRSYNFEHAGAAKTFDIRNGGVGEWLKPAVLKNETGCLLSC
jgi:hypothetical protein